MSAIGLAQTRWFHQDFAEKILHVQPSLGVLPSIPRCRVEIRAWSDRMPSYAKLKFERKVSRQSEPVGRRQAAARGTTGMRANGGVWVVVYGAEIAEIWLAVLLTRPSIAGCVARAPLVTMG